MSVQMVVFSILGIFLVGGAIIFYQKKIYEDVIYSILEVLEYQERYDFSFKNHLKAAKYIGRKDKIGLTMRTLANSEARVREVITKTIETAMAVLSSSEQLMSISEQNATVSEDIAKTIEEIAKGATEQAEDTGKGAEAMSILGNHVEENKKLIQNLNENTQELLKLKDEGLNTIKKLVEATEANRQSAGTIQEVILSTNDSARNIEKASDMIKSIAEQTNLLALNAAIEAARAGEAGRGFAVVADEIRKLAEDSNKFTEDIRKIVSQLTEKSSNAVDTMNEVGAIVEVQTQNVEKTKDQFNCISESLENNNTILSKINKSSLEIDKQNKGMLDVIESLSAIAEENAASTEEASASVEEQSASIHEIANSSQHLTELANDLNQLIAQFKI